MEDKKELAYISGFGSSMASEALPNALPVGQNSPKLCPYGLYAEQLSGTAFTAPRSKNQRSWLYRIRPSVQHDTFEPYTFNGFKHFRSGAYDTSKFVVNPNQMRWSPRTALNTGAESYENGVDFVDGLEAICGAGDPSIKEGLCIYTYLANKGMTGSGSMPATQNCKRAFSSADGDFLIVPQEGILIITTEFGKMTVAPCEIAVIQRGIKFSVDFVSSPHSHPDPTQRECSRGYVLEVFKGHFELPNLGPIGANGLANPRDFLTPVASFENPPDGEETEFELINKYMGSLFTCKQKHTPYNVLAWHGNYAPYKYDLRKFCAMNSVTFDHPDPSIFTVLTCPSDEPGTAVADFVVFPPRWIVAENTFRPPYFHRNCMSEYMGMIYGQYDAKEQKKGEQGFVPGGSSIHACMTPHGPDNATYRKAADPLTQQLPVYQNAGMAFMFESTYLLKIAPQGMESPTLQHGYAQCWEELPKMFNGDIDPYKV